MRSSSYDIQKGDVLGGEVLKKIIFESQRQMARTLLDKTAREDHSLSKKLETQMLIAQASRKAAKTLKAEEMKVRLATAIHPGTIGFKSMMRNSSSKEAPLKSDLIQPTQLSEERIAEEKPAVTSIPNKNNHETKFTKNIRILDVTMSLAQKNCGSEQKEISSTKNHTRKRKSAINPSQLLHSTKI